MITIAQRLTAGFGAAAASTVVFAAVLSLFATPVHAADAEQAKAGAIGGVLVAQPGASEVRIVRHAGTAADGEAAARRAANDTGFLAWGRGCGRTC
jgi:hypothetical protein